MSKIISGIAEGQVLQRRQIHPFQVTHLEMGDPGDGLPFINGDLRSSKDVAKACEGMDAVVHIAALHGAAWNKVGVDVRDVAQSHLLALRAPDAMKHEVFIITADTAEFSGRIAELAGSNAEWYTVEKAKRLLGYRPQYNCTLN